MPVPARPFLVSVLLIITALLSVSCRAYSYWQSESWMARCSLREDVGESLVERTSMDDSGGRVRGIAQ
jgi:hypothetical protein